MYTEFIQAVQAAKTVFITAHVGPDGDTLGSMLAFKHAFEKACPHLERVDCVIAGKMPDVYRFLPGIREVKNVETATDLLPRYDLSISVDCGSLDRLGPSGRFFAEAAMSVNIDHHISNNRFGKLNIVEATAGASGEVVADILQEMGIALDANIAPCIYTAILTDTGGFKFSNTSPKIFHLAADLVAAGASPEQIYKAIYEERPRIQMQLHADVLLNAQFNPAQTLAWATVTRDDLAKHGATDEHLEGIVEALRQVDTVIVSALFKENSHGATKVSLRSDSHDIDVAELMGRFGGGGHKMASGCTMEMPPAEAHKVLLPILESLVTQQLAAGKP